MDGMAGVKNLSFFLSLAVTVSLLGCAANGQQGEVYFPQIRTNSIEIIGEDGKTLISIQALEVEGVHAAITFHDDENRRHRMSLLSTDNGPVLGMKDSDSGAMIRIAILPSPTIEANYGYRRPLWSLETDSEGKGVLITNDPEED